MSTTILSVILHESLAPTQEDNNILSVKGHSSCDARGYRRRNRWVGGGRGDHGGVSRGDCGGGGKT